MLQLISTPAMMRSVLFYIVDLEAFILLYCFVGEYLNDEVSIKNLESVTLIKHENTKMYLSLVEQNNRR